MKKLDSRKKTFMILSACLILLTSMKLKSRQYTPKVGYNNQFEIGSEEPFGTYRNGNVYIGDSEFIDRILDDSTDDVYVVDLRSNENPRIIVSNSYEFRNKDEMNDILELLQEYEIRYPTAWERSMGSMMNEWCVHNILYDFSFERSHTKHVDFDNMDEELYNSKLLTKIFKN